MTNDYPIHGEVFEHWPSIFQLDLLREFSFPVLHQSWLWIASNTQVRKSTDFEILNQSQENALCAFLWTSYRRTQQSPVSECYRNHLSNTLILSTRREAQVASWAKGKAVLLVACWQTVGSLGARGCNLTSNLIWSRPSIDDPTLRSEVPHFTWCHFLGNSNSSSESQWSEMK